MGTENLGIGVMIGLLSGNEKSVEAFSGGVGKKITSLNLIDDDLVFEFEDGYRMALYDDGQSCCEHRYMTCDDDLSAYVGSSLQSAEVEDGPNVEGECEDHETAFLKVTTSAGTFTATTHNEHNGYYGGFLVRARVLSPAKAKD